MGRLRLCWVRIGQKIAAYSVAVTFLIMLCCVGAYAADDNRTVRIGYFPMNGFHEYDNAGLPSGYDVDYLNKIAEYTRWKYDYIRVENWDQALTLLRENKIDLVGSAQMTEERAAEYDFCAYANGTTYGTLVALEGNRSLVYEDFKAFDDLKIGCVKSYIRQAEFRHFAEKNGFLPRFVYFDDTTKMREALHAGEIDAVIMSIMEVVDKEKIIAKFSSAPFYYMTCKGNSDLLEALNEAIFKIKIDTPELENSLMNRYYPDATLVPFTKQELDYIKTLPSVEVGCIADRAPISFVDEKNGTVTGIVKAIMDQISQESGIVFEYTAIPTDTAPIPYLKAGNTDIVAGVALSEGNLNDPDIRVSNAFQVGKMVVVGRKGEPYSPNLPLKVAIPQGFQASVENVEKYYPNFEMTFYQGTANCLNAIKEHEADIMIQNSYMVEKFLQGPRYRDLSVMPIDGWDEPLCIAMPAETDPLFISVINKAISRVPQAVIDQCVINYTVANPYQITLEDFILQYQTMLVVIALLLIICVGMGWYATKQKRKSMEVIRRNEKTLSNITNNINGGVITLIPDAGFTITYANNGFLSLIGYSREEYENEKVNAGLTYVHSDDIAILNDAIKHKSQSGETVEVELRIRQRNGRHIPVIFRGTVSENEEHEVVLHCVVVDITAQKQILEDLEIEKERYRTIVEQSDDIIFDVDWEIGRIVFSEQFKERFGRQAEQYFIGKNFLDDLMIHSEDTAVILHMVERLSEGDKTAEGQLRIQKNDGHYLWCEIQMNRVSKENRPVKAIGKIIDIDAQIRERERLEKLSQHDPLTGLYNKAAFRVKVEQYLQSTPISEMSCVFMFVDLDNFKAVNDKLGHLIGDQALQDTASVLRQIFREDDIIGRFGGDEFCIFLKQVPGEVLTKKAGQICEMLLRIYTDELDNIIEISASVGVYCCSNTQMTYDDMLKNADDALYKSKELGKNQYVIRHERQG